MNFVLLYSEQFCRRNYLPNHMTMTKVQRWDNLTKEFSGFFWSKATFFHEIIEKFTACDMLENQISWKFMKSSTESSEWYHSLTLTNIFDSHKHHINVRHEDVQWVSLWQFLFRPEQTMNDWSSSWLITYFHQDWFGQGLTINNFDRHLLTR